MKRPQINIVVPLYNEEETYGHLVDRLVKLLNDSPLSIQVILVDDRSTDSTAALIRQTCTSDTRFSGVLLARNYGHQIALSAGLQHIDCTEGVFIIDGDLQDPPELLDTFYQKLKEGYDVVYGVRKMNEKEGFFKKTTSHLFYRLLAIISNTEIPFDSGDFSLISTRVAEHLNKMPEKTRFIRGMRASLGYKQIGVPFKREKRGFGESKYTAKKMFNLALDAIFSFSTLPYKFMIKVGLISILLTFVCAAIALVNPSWLSCSTSLMVIMGFGLFTFGFLVTMLGIFGGYLSRMFLQTQGRPLFVIDEVITNNQ